MTTSFGTSTLALLAAEEPSSLLAARWQMALSLGWHIVLACFGVAFPMLIWVVHRRGIRDADDVALGLAKRWSKVAAVLFAVGAVSGTILSFEMGLLWPELMRTYGDVIGLPFALEGIAFFIEAIFIGVYLYGWGRLPPKVHLFMLVPIAVSGVVGTFCILSVNAWMNTPAGFRLVDGAVTDVDPWAAMFNPGVWVQFAHMWVATVMVVGFSTAAVYAAGLLRGRDDRHHRLGFRVAFAFAAVAALVQPLIGHLAGARLADAQPTKLAAMELAPRTEQPAPLVIGGVLLGGERRFAIEIPRLGSLIARADVDRPVQGLEEFPADERPRDALVTIVHLSFQTMVAIGLTLALLGAVFWWRTRRGRDLLGSRAVPLDRAARGPGVGGGAPARVDDDRARPPAVGRLPPDARRGRRDPRLGRVGDPPGGDRGLRGDDRDGGAHPAVDGPPLAGGRAPRPADALLTIAAGGRIGRDAAVSLPDVVAAILFLGIVAYAVFAGADFGSGVWDLTAGDAEAGAPDAVAHRPGHRPGVGGQPRLARSSCWCTSGRGFPGPSRPSWRRCSSRSAWPGLASSCGGPPSRSARWRRRSRWRGSTAPCSRHPP